MRVFSTSLLCCALLASGAQDRPRELRFVPWFGDHELKLDEEGRLKDGTRVRISSLRFYVGIPVVAGDGEAALLTYDYHLIDAADPTTWAVTMHHHGPRYFLLGVDSLTNVSGAFGGDLDPTKGMYWTWNSGYINFKLEGTSPICPARGNQFEFHVGGYLPPFVSAQRIELPVIADGPFEIHVDVAALLANVDLPKEYNVMSPGEKAVHFAGLAANAFHAQGAKP